MSAQAETRIFGLKVGVSPKVLMVALIALTVLFVWYSWRGGDDDREGVAAAHPAIAGTAQPAPSEQTLSARRAVRSQNEHAALKLKPVNPSRGDIDPTLRLGLLARLQAVKPEEGLRNLFDGSIAANLPPLPKIQRMIPKPVPEMVPAGRPVTPIVPVLNIPLKYYGYVRPGAKIDANRGFFMDGDNILIATEGDVLEQKFLVVSLSPTLARVEDIQLKQGQDLQFTPEATAQ